jgi:hypothetical protein
VVFPARVEGDGGSPPSGASEPAEKPPEVAHAPPDPQPLRMREQWEVDIHYSRGELSVESVEARDYDVPVVTERRVGRFAVELWIGHELVERVRFDFPMLAAEPAPTGPRRALDAPPTLGAGADTRVHIRVPRSQRATRAVLVDRATGRTQDLPWPPDAPLDTGPRGVSADGGARPEPR